LEGPNLEFGTWNLELPKVYPITDTRLSGLSHTEQVRRLIAGGATFIQLREKQMSPREFYEDAAEAVRVARRSGVTILINDRVDLALYAGADGVHLGQDDIPVEAARRLLVDGAIIGYSTHSREQAVAAANLPVDYIAIGPVFATATKDDPSPVVGLEGIRSVRAAIGEMPLVAIGGIRANNVDDVIAAGADSAAMIGGIVSGPGEIEHEMRRLLTREA
jgi:thiamine-phosphate pyrophosphorylase